jgi:TolA-binding protein
MKLIPLILLLSILVWPLQVIATVNINLADKNELLTLPDLSETMAEEIINHRQSKGNFSTPFDLMKVKGMTGENFSKIMKLITTEGDPKPTSFKQHPAKGKRIQQIDDEKPGNHRVSKKTVTVQGELAPAPTAGQGRIGRQVVTPESILKAGFGLARRGKFRMADSMFKQFSDKYPSHSRIDDARYLRAACLEEQEKYKMAIEEYEIVFNNRYSKFRAISLMRIGMCHDMMEDFESAISSYRSFLTNTDEQFIASQWRQTVKDRLEELTK